MTKRLTLLFITIFFTCSLFSQLKIPILGLHQQQCNGVTAEDNNTVFQFFRDSTFTLTEYTFVSRLFYQIRKTELKGRYFISADTIFLNDSASRFFPFIKDSSIYIALAKDAGLRLFPAKIILKANDGIYISYLNKPRKVSKLEYSQIWNLEKGI